MPSCFAPHRLGAAESHRPARGCCPSWVNDDAKCSVDDRFVLGTGEQIDRGNDDLLGERRG